MNKFKPVGISIPKFQLGTDNNGVQLLEYKGPQYYDRLQQMKREDPDSYDRLQEAAAQVSASNAYSLQEQPNTSEILKPWVDSKGKIHRSSNAEAGYVSGTDPIGQLYIEGAILNKPLQWAGTGLLYGLGRSGNTWAKAKLISEVIDNMKQIPIISKDNAFSMSKKAWDLAYETALKRGNIELLKKLRELHFWSKSGNDSQVFAHSTNKIFNKFNNKFFGATDEGYNGKGFYFTTTRIPENPKLIKVAKGPSGEIPSMNYGPRKYYVYLKGNRQFDVANPNRNFFNEKNTVGFVNPSNMKGPSEVIIGNPVQIKSARTITYDDKGNFIPLSKRDNFTNPDIRY